MRKTFTRIISAAIAIATCSSIAGQTFAQENQPITTSSAVYDQNTRNDLKDIAPEDIIYDSEMIALVEQRKEELEAFFNSRASLPSSYTAPATWQQQQEGNYCGPATASIILNNLSSITPPTQYQIAGSNFLRTNSGGTPWYEGDNQQANLTNPRNYNMMWGLNQWQQYQAGRNEWSYVVYPFNETPTNSGYINNIKYTVYMDYLVAINGKSVGGTNSHIDGYPNGRVGHWLVCNGWTSNSRYYIVDPASGTSGFNNVKPQYDIPESKLLAFIKAGNGIVC